MRPRADCGPAGGCSFAGAWGGGGGRGLRRVKVLSYFFDRATQTGLLPDADEPSAYIQANEFLIKAKEVCAVRADEVERVYPDVEEKDRAFICFDLLYEHLLIAEGFGLGGAGGRGSAGEEDDVQLELVKRVRYNGGEVEAGWALGAAISSMDSCAEGG